ncbi:hypothetical protein BKA70DRAFT_1464713, partial [Coprinopsis sp. MPI-PUGE-AT-0042]
MATSATAFEEAAYIASEFIYSIDNLPSEVSHILQEIRHRDSRSQELQNEIDKDTARYIRHSIRASANSTPLAAAPPPRAPSPKSLAIPGKVAAAYAEIKVLAGEKEELAQRLVDVMQRTRTRLDIELNKVRVLQGEPIDSLPTPGKGMPVLVPNDPSFRNPALAVTESLRNALGAMPIAEAASISVGGSTSNKRRKVGTATPSIKIHPPVQDEDDEMDAEVDEEGEGDDGDGDDRLYCYCQSQSYGDMIACDNEGECPYEWV